MADPINLSYARTTDALRDLLSQNQKSGILRACKIAVSHQARDFIEQLESSMIGACARPWLRNGEDMKEFERVVVSLYKDHVCLKGIKEYNALFG